MNRYRLSRKVRDTDAVALGGKDGRLIIRAQRSSELFGVWTEGHDRITLTLKGEKIVTSHPRGVIRYGEVEVRTSE